MKPPSALYRLLSSETVVLGLDVGDKAAAINALVDLLADRDDVEDLERLRSDVFVREATLSTGVGMGLALPHARTTAVADSLAAFAVLAAPLDWDAIDGAPVEMVLLLAGTAHDRSRHITLLSRIMRLMNRPGFASSLRDAPTPDAVVERIRIAERGRSD
jgi:mannitol/fructose-specific phosphotransferase system IIA component (Ntr-type)